MRTNYPQLVLNLTELNGYLSAIVERGHPTFSDGIETWQRVGDVFGQVHAITYPANSLFADLSACNRIAKRNNSIFVNRDFLTIEFCRRCITNATLAIEQINLAIALFGENK